MQIKSKNIFLILCFFSLIIFNGKVNSDEFNISALEINLEQESKIVTGVGSVVVTDNTGNTIKADKAIYNKNKNFLIAEGSVNIVDEVGNILNTDKILFDKNTNIITSENNSELLLKEGYKLLSNKIFYNNKNKIISSMQTSTISDLDGNTIYVDMFEYQIKNHLFSSLGKIKVVDNKKNKYFFKELYVDTKKYEMIGSDVSIEFDQENFGTSIENDPRLVANDIFISKNKSNLSKGVFTVCKKRGDQCPPWSLKAKKITHDRAKKTIFYKHATLKVYDIPVFYFPQFYHPDPTVKRQSGFLTPFFTDTTNLGTGFGLPYYWAISQDKDLTFTPKIYAKENILILNEYRQAFRNSFLTLDTSYTEGYKETTETKTAGSRNHIFAKLDINLGEDKPYESDLAFQIQKTSNDTYFKIHDINTALVDSDNLNLVNKIDYNFAKDNIYLNISGSVHEDLSEENNSRYEYVLPNVLFGKSFFTEKFGIIDFKSNALYKNYKVDKHLSSLENDLIWNSGEKINKKGFVNSLIAVVNNTNYEATNDEDYKTEGTINELSGVLSYKSSLPLKKEGENYFNIFSPTLMFRYGPGHMRNLSSEDARLNYLNLYSTNKTSVIEDGLSTILGFDFKKNIKLPNGNNKEKFSLSMGQVFNLEENPDMPSNSSLDQKTSDIVGVANYNFSKIGNIGYKFSIDHNLNDINYNEISTILNFGKVEFNLDYLEERNHIGEEHYATSGISLNLSKNNKLNFSTKKNFKTESTELYDISYQYTNDCLTAGLVFRREFYADSESDIEPSDSLMFKITFVPFSGVNTPAINP